MGSHHKSFSHGGNGWMMMRHLGIIVMMSIVGVITNVMAVGALHRFSTSTIITTEAVANPYQHQRKMQKLPAASISRTDTSFVLLGDAQEVDTSSHTSDCCLTKLRGGSSSITSNVGGMLKLIVRYGIQNPILILSKYLKKKNITKIFLSFHTFGVIHTCQLQLPTNLAYIANFFMYFGKQTTTTKVLLGSTLLVVYKDKIPIASRLLQPFLQGGIVGYVFYSLATWQQQQQQQQQNEATSNIVNMQEKEKEEEPTATAEASNE